MGNATVHFVECQHRSGRGIHDQMKTLWGSFVVETPAGNLYFAGDTGYSPHFKAQGERYGPFALSLLPIGAYEPRWFMKDIHLNPEEAVRAHRDLNSTQSLGIHLTVIWRVSTHLGNDRPADHRSRGRSPRATGAANRVLGTRTRHLENAGDAVRSISKAAQKFAPTTRAKTSANKKSAVSPGINCATLSDIERPVNVPCSNHPYSARHPTRG